MAKKTLTPSTVAVNNVRLLDDEPKNQSTQVKTAMDQYGIDDLSYTNDTHLPELTTSANDTSGAHGVGFGSTQGDITSDNVGDALDEIVTIAKDAQAGTIIPGSITDTMLSNATGQIKDRVAEDAVNLDVLRIAETDTGAANAYVVDTPGTFSRVDGNTFSFIPSNNNTGASTINEDTTGVASIKKYVDGAWIDLEEGDIKKFQKVDLTWNASESAFTLAPKGGANPMEDWKNTSSAYSEGFNVGTLSLKASIVGAGWIIAIANPSSNGNFSIKIDGSDFIGVQASNLACALPQRSTSVLMARFETGFEYYDTGGTTYQIFYVLGDKYEEGVLKVATNAASASTTNLKINVTGEGWFYGGHSNSGDTRFVIDSTEVETGRDMVGIGAVVKFNTSLQLYFVSGSGTSQIFYTYTLLP